MLYQSSCFKTMCGHFKIKSLKISYNSQEIYMLHHLDENHKFSP